jgi:H/ACA ribonucleoprotein complex subunit 3
MYLRYFLDTDGKRKYTFKFHDEEGNPTISAHPARFSKDDPYQKQRMKCKERFNLLLIQKPEKVL